MYEHNEIVNKEIEIMSRNQTDILELKSTITEIKNLLRCSTEDLSCQEKKSVKLKIKQLKLYSLSRKKKNKWRKMSSLRDPLSGPTYTLWESSIHRMRREKGTERLFEEIMDKNFSNLIKDVSNLIKDHWSLWEFMLIIQASTSIIILGKVSKSMACSVLDHLGKWIWGCHSTGFNF